MDKLFWRLINWRLQREFKKLGFPLWEGKPKARWEISVAGTSICFSADVPNSDADMGRTLEELGKGMQITEAPSNFPGMR